MKSIILSDRVADPLKSLDQAAQGIHEISDYTAEFFSQSAYKCNHFYHIQGIQKVRILLDILKMVASIDMEFEGNFLKQKWANIS